MSRNGANKAPSSGNDLPLLKRQVKESEGEKTNEKELVQHFYALCLYAHTGAVTVGGSYPRCQYNERGIHNMGRGMFNAPLYFGNNRCCAYFKKGA